MLTTLQRVVTQAQRDRYAVGAFNISDLEQAQAVIAAAKAQRSPVIINTSESAITYAGGAATLTAIVTILAKKTRIPIVLNLDHGKSYRTASECLKAGYTGIMFDGSRLPDAQNITQTRRVVVTAKKYGVGVEGEIGQVKYVEDAKRPKTGAGFTKTDPAAAVHFVRSTGVVAFAVAIGNAHGVPEADEKLDFPLLRAIRRVVSIPLVLHGASGTPPAQIRQAIAAGIAKINIDTDLRLAFSAALRRTLAADRSVFDPRHELAPARDAVQKVVMEKMSQFGSRHRIRL